MRQKLLEMERKNLIGKLITLIQLFVSVICIVTVAGSGMLPKKYLIFLIGALAVLFGATHTDKYFYDKGVLMGTIFGKLAYPLIVALFIKNREQTKECGLNKAIKKAYEGIKKK